MTALINSVLLIAFVATSVRSAGVALFMCRVWRSGGVRSFSLDRVLCFCFESGVVVVSAAGWPATVDGWAVVGGQEQGGVKGWFRSMAIPRRWADKT